MFPRVSGLREPLGCLRFSFGQGFYVWYYYVSVFDWQSFVSFQGIFKDNCGYNHLIIDLLHRIRSVSFSILISLIIFDTIFYHKSKVDIKVLLQWHPLRGERLVWYRTWYFTSFESFSSYIFGEKTSRFNATSPVIEWCRVVWLCTHKSIISAFCALGG